MPNQRTYLDYAATTPVDPRVLQAMLPFFTDNFGNPSSFHRLGQQADSAVETSRRRIADMLGCSPSEIIFTSCGSESDNLALRGTAFHARESRSANHILTTPVEHHAILRTAQELHTHHGFELELLPVDGDGRVDPDELAKRIRKDTAIVSIMYANNEIGSINPLEKLGEICRSMNVPFHTDAVQAASQLETDVNPLNVDMMSLGAHKFYGPKGVGLLYIRDGHTVYPVQTGGNQEFGLRAGTHNVPLIVGMAEALAITHAEREAHNSHFRGLRDRLLKVIPERVPAARITGHTENRLPNHASFIFHKIDGNQLLAALDIAGFACSSGSACKTGDPEPSNVLKAIGVPHEWSLGSLRLSVGRGTSSEGIEAFLATLPVLIEKLRAVKA